MKAWHTRLVIKSRFSLVFDKKLSFATFILKCVKNIRRPYIDNQVFFMESYQMHIMNQVGGQGITDTCTYVVSLSLNNDHNFLGTVSFGNIL